MTLQRFLADTGFRAMSRTHRAVLHLSGGRLGASALGMPVVELHVTGRKTGRPRTAVLTAPIADSSRVVLVASKGGDDRDPEWYRNLLAQPDIELVIGGQRRPMRARPASAEEKAELWPRVVAANKGYAGYQSRTRRDIPLVICEPR
jgi:deazaflavin-dependent oxidoreductase (nitroreductase family)